MDPQENPPMPRITRHSAMALVLALGACNQMGDGGGEAVAVADENACGASEYQSFVGQRVDALNEVDLPDGARVLFPTTPATMDYNAARLNISIGGNDLIERAFCG
jgi:hypothetical protein